MSETLKALEKAALNYTPDTEWELISAAMEHQDSPEADRLPALLSAAREEGRRDQREADIKLLHRWDKWHGEMVEAFPINATLHQEYSNGYCRAWRVLTDGEEPPALPAVAGGGAEREEEKP